MVSSVVFVDVVVELAGPALFGRSWLGRKSHREKNNNEINEYNPPEPARACSALEMPLT
jgi:hypothetical protein